MNSKMLGTLAATLLLTGCATPPPTVEEETAVWLSEAPRTLKLTIEPELPKPSLRVRDHKVGERVLKGAGGAALGAGMSLVYGCAGGGPLGCIVGAMIAPVGAAVGLVYGASKPDSVDVYHGIEAAQGAPALYTAGAKADDLTAQLAQAVLAEAGRGEARRHRLGTGEGGDGELTLAISTLDLAGADGEDPRVGIVLAVNAKLTYAGGGMRSWTFEHLSSRRAVSAWAENDATAFREELARGMKAISADVVQSLHEAPGFGVAAKVAAARERRVLATR
jgi:hypothetical protein